MYGRSILCVLDTTDHGRNSHEEKSLYLAHTRTIREVLRQRSWWLKVEAEAIFHVRINRIKWIPLRVVCAATHNTQAHPHATGSTRSVQTLAPRSSQYIDADENTSFECKNKGRRQTWALSLSHRLREVKNKLTPTDYSTDSSLHRAPH